MITFPCSQHSCWQAARRVSFLITLSFSIQLSAAAQQVNNAAATQQAEKPAAAAATTNAGSALLTQKATGERYRIGPGDLLDIRVFGKPQFSRESVRVDSRGMIRMPLIQDEIMAACRTEAELAAEINRLLLEFVRRPQVDVFIKEYQSQPVAVLGAVRAPSRFQLNGPCASSNCSPS